MSPETIRPTCIEAVQAAVREHARVLPRGGGSKPALSTPPDGVASLDLAGLAGVVEYESQEFTFTALAGTRVAQVSALLAARGQTMPFDPPLAEHGATLGGTVAGGVSGPGRYRSGGVRDFILGLRYVDGEGRVVRSGGKVVKNSAGFDLQKLLLGSLGGFGVIVEATFKVFPRPEAFATLRLACKSPDDALAALVRLSMAPLDIEALDLEPAPGGAAVWVRLGGLASALPARLERLRGVAGAGLSGEIVAGEAETEAWRAAREFTWAPDGWSLVKVPVTPRRIPALESRLPEARRRYSAGGQVAWIATPEPLAALDAALAAEGLAGVVLRGPAGRPRLGVRTGESFERRIKAALDPLGRFVEV